MAKTADISTSTLTIPDVALVPQHIAIIMDGNGRWAKNRLMPRVAGHVRGVETVRKVVAECVRLGVKHLTLFAFSSENWRRPADEVGFLMRLFMKALDREVGKLHDRNICLKIVGDRCFFDAALQEKIALAEAKTQHNSGLVLSVAANYGGRWDVLQAVNHALLEHQSSLPTGASLPALTEADITPHLALSYAPEPDLFIRTGGEQRISNFLLWQMAYTELYFTDELWPDFDEASLGRAIASYQRRERRFGRISEQLHASSK